jgi:hypothetical protein
VSNYGMTVENSMCICFSVGFMYVWSPIGLQFFLFSCNLGSNPHTVDSAYVRYGHASVGLSLVWVCDLLSMTMVHGNFFKDVGRPIMEPLTQYLDPGYSVAMEIILLLYDIIAM